MKKISQYQTVQWISRRKEILKRDNFTCKKCKTFNPSIDYVTVYNEQNEDLELHYYDSSSSTYIITSQKNGITINIDYQWGVWLVLPILQVHHLKYIEGLNIWESPDSDLITLCKKCHTETHSNNKIDVFRQSGSYITSKFCSPSDEANRKSHDFEPWNFKIKTVNDYEMLTSIKPTLGFCVDASRLGEYEEIAVQATMLYLSFMDRYFPHYKLDI